MRRNTGRRPSTPDFDEGRLTDCAVHGEPVRAEVEAAYRRGFAQGAAIAFEAMRNGASEAHMLRWIYARLLKWRYRCSAWRAGQMKRACEPPAAPGCGKVA